VITVGIYFGAYGFITCSYLRQLANKQRTLDVLRQLDVIGLLCTICTNLAKLLHRTSRVGLHMLKYTAYYYASVCLFR